MVGPCKSPHSSSWQPEAIGIAGAEAGSGRAGPLTQGKPRAVQPGALLGGLQLSAEGPRGSLWRNCRIVGVSTIGSSCRWVWLLQPLRYWLRSGLWLSTGAGGTRAAGKGVKRWGDAAELLDRVEAGSLLSAFEGFVYGLDRIGFKEFYWFNTYVVGSYLCLENAC